MQQFGVAPPQQRVLLLRCQRLEDRPAVETSPLMRFEAPCLRKGACLLRRCQCVALCDSSVRGADLLKTLSVATRRVRMPTLGQTPKRVADFGEGGASFEAEQPIVGVQFRQVPRPHGHPARRPGNRLHFRRGRPAPEDRAPLYCASLVIDIQARPVEPKPTNRLALSLPVWQRPTTGSVGRRSVPHAGVRASCGCLPRLAASGPESPTRRARAPGAMTTSQAGSVTVFTSRPEWR